MTAWYNENDPKAAAWLRELIAGGHLAPGVVDERSIEDIVPNELREFTQCHFFAGIGGWSLALRLAGWPDDRPVWTGSCPCQPFSAAGKGAGYDDERHLWPAWHHLIRECRPSVLFGEQVEAAIRYGWLDLVRDDLEGCGYAFGAAGLPAACVGAPHIRQRLWFVADAGRLGGEPHGYDLGSPPDCNGREAWEQRVRTDPSSSDFIGGMADVSVTGWSRRTGRDDRPDGRPTQEPGRLRDAGELGHPDGEREGAIRGIPGWSSVERARSPWADIEWLACRDGKARPAEPGIQPLAHGVPNRVGLLRGAGNAIVPQCAQAVIESYLTVSSGDC